jgi:hypothetical protein
LQDADVPPLETIEEEKQPEIKFKNMGAPKVATGEVIALPAADDTTGNKSPEKDKLSYNQQQILGWKGDIVNELLPMDSSESPEEEAWFI